MSNHTFTGLVLGIALAFAVIFGGWLGLIYVLVFGAVGTIIGAQLDGRIDLSAIFTRGSRG